MTTLFAFPKIHDFPPFFTRQPNESTWQSQRSGWIALILSYCRHHRIYRLDLGADLLANDLFTNPTLHRSLKIETLREILDALAKEGSGEWITVKGKKQGACLIYWRRPEEWATSLTRYIEETGQNTSVLTLHELTHSSTSAAVSTGLGGSDQGEFEGMDGAMMRKVIEVLVKKGSCGLMKGPDGEDLGVKFFL